MEDKFHRNCITMNQLTAENYREQLCTRKKNMHDNDSQLSSVSNSGITWCMAKRFSVSDELRLLCTKVGITPHRIDVTPVYALHCSVHKNFAMI